MSETDPQTPNSSTLGGALLEIALFSLIIGAVLYVFVWRGDMPLRWVVTAHIVLSLIMSVPVVLLAEKLFETLVVTVMLTGIAWLALPAYFDYTARHAVAEAVRVGDAVAQALDRSPAKRPVDQLGVAIPADKVAVTLQADGSFTLMLAEPPLAGKQVSFVPSASKGARTWRCSSRDIAQPHLPSRCRE